MITPNLVGVTKLRDPEFLDCIDIYNNEYFIVVRRDVPYILGFPIVMLEKIRNALGDWEITEINKRQIQRGKIFGKIAPDIGKIYILQEKKLPLFAFVRFTPFKTYPAIAGAFENQKLYYDHLWDYYKPYLPPFEIKRIMTARFLEHGEIERIDLWFYKENREEILGSMKIPKENIDKIENVLLYNAALWHH